jgi:hypothetical protein
MVIRGWSQWKNGVYTKITKKLSKMKSWCIMGFWGQHLFKYLLQERMYTNGSLCNKIGPKIKSWLITSMRTSSPNKHCQHLCIFPPSTSYHLPPTKPLKNKTHTSRQWNDCWLTKHTSTFYLFTFHLHFQTFHILDSDAPCELDDLKPLLWPMRTTKRI